MQRDKKFFMLVYVVSKVLMIVDNFLKYEYTLQDYFSYDTIKDIMVTRIIIRLVNFSQVIWIGLIFKNDY